MEFSSNSKLEICQECNKKIKLMSFSCKCGNKYCMKHMSPIDHNCVFNFKEEHKKKILKSNPVITPQKIVNL